MAKTVLKLDGVHVVGQSVLLGKFCFDSSGGVLTIEYNAGTFGF